ncbi:MAG: sugar ABC transporter ATP-binding protein [Candidatus Rokubacteria bacterium]|nr:sugar ABC transporter ATP-binding protein [Candidatus Rokubacteria bacterium]
MRGISKAFGAVQALSGVDLELGAGEVLGLVGDNAAGKSTLMKALTGVHRPDEGEIVFAGRPVHFHSPRDSRALGIEMIYQNLALAPNLDVVANVFLGREVTRKALPHAVEWLDERAMEAGTWELLRRLKITIDSVRKPVERLSGGQQQAVAIARAVAFQARVVIMDEPTASLAVKEVGKVLDLVRQLKAKGVGVILISHRLQDIFSVGDRVMVLRGGQRVAAKPLADTTMDEVVKYIVGAEPGALSSLASGR